MPPGIFQGQVWEKNFEPKKAVFPMFPHPKFLQQLFPYPNLNIGKIWAGNEGRCPSYEGEDTPYPLHGPIVCRFIDSMGSFIRNQLYYYSDFA